MIHWRKQLEHHAVAIVSLMVALSALLYTTWRYEETESNWNVRVGGFEMLVNLAELQRIVYLNHYDGDVKEGNPRNGWVRVLLLRDLGEIMPEPLPAQSQKLLAVWQQSWSGIGGDQAAVDRIDASIDETRMVVLEVLGGLK